MNTEINQTGNAEIDQLIAEIIKRHTNPRLVSRRRYNVSEKGRACDRRRRATEKRQEYMREWERLHKFERLLMARVRRQHRRVQENAI